MTTIAYKDGIMAADTQVTQGDMVGGYVQKVHLIGGYLVGAAGRLADLQELLTFVESGEKTAPENMSPDLQALIVDKHGDVTVFENGKFLQYEAPFYTLGSGGAIAAGVMSKGFGAVEAVEAAMELDVFSGGEVHVGTITDLVIQETETAELMAQITKASGSKKKKKKKKKCKAESGH